MKNPFIRTSAAITLQSAVRKKICSRVHSNINHIHSKNVLEEHLNDLIKEHSIICKRYKEHTDNLKKLFKLVKKMLKDEKKEKNKIKKYKIEKKEKINKEGNVRKKTDYQWTELLVCVYLLQILPNYDKKTIINNKQKILLDPRFKYNSKIIEKYFYDLQGYVSNKDISKYMLNINNDLNDLDFKYIYLTGKKITFPIINHLTKSNKLNERQKKGDIYLEYENNSFTSISVKKEHKCTLTNYPTEKLAKDSNLFDIVKKTKECRLNICKQYIPHFGTKEWKSLSSKEKKKQYKLVRKNKINKTLYNSNLDFWKCEEQIINNSHVQQSIIEGMFPDVSFQNISYDGDAWKVIMSYKNIQSYTFKRCTKLDTNVSAKIWYILYINKKLQYIMEIRGKNEIYGDGAIQAFVYHKKTRFKDIQINNISEYL